MSDNEDFEEGIIECKDVKKLKYAILDNNLSYLKKIIHNFPLNSLYQDLGLTYEDHRHGADGFLNGHGYEYEDQRGHYKEFFHFSSYDDNPYDQDFILFSPLHYASILDEKQEIILFLLEKGADIELLDSVGNSIFDLISNDSEKTEIFEKWAKKMKIYSVQNIPSKNLSFKFENDSNKIYDWLSGTVERRSSLGLPVFDQPARYWDDLDPHVYEFSYQAFPPYVGVDSTMVLNKAGYGPRGLIHFTITLTNDAPVTPSLTRTAEATTPLEIPLTGTVNDPNSDPLFFVSFSGITCGNVVYDSTKFQFVFTASVEGTCSFQYSFNDEVYQSTGTITVTVTPKKCYGLEYTDPTVCSGRGVCTSSNNCACMEGFSGLTCNVHSCFGVNATDINACSSKGNCTALNTCQCQPFWSGFKCQFPQCFGVNSTDPTVCSGNGVCSDVDKCTCKPGWSGPLCNQVTCFGVNSTDSRVCSSNGACVGPDSCQCKDGYTGNTCQFPICHGVNSTNPQVCSGNGQCTSPNQCSCKYGWSGFNCSSYSCFGVNSTEASVCSSNGNCSAVDTCQCQEKWSGFKCQFPQCFGVNATDPSVCSGNGICSGIDQCACKEAYNGLSCSIFMCFGINNTDTNVCSGKGNCTSTNKCQCIESWSGSTCLYPQCFGVNARNPTVCSGNGVCRDVNQCTCNSRWEGFNCANTSCFGLNSSDSRACSGNGVCVSPDLCKCSETTTGKSCELCKGDSCNLHWKGTSGDWKNPSNWLMNVKGELKEIDQVPSVGNFFINQKGSFSIQIDSLDVSLNRLIIGGPESNVNLTIKNTRFKSKEILLDKLASLELHNSRFNTENITSFGTLKLKDSSFEETVLASASNSQLFNYGKVIISTEFKNITLNLPIHNYGELQINGNSTTFISSYNQYENSKLLLLNSKLITQNNVKINSGDIMLGGELSTPHFYFLSNNGKMNVISPLMFNGNVTLKNTTTLFITVNGSNFNWVNVRGHLKIESLILVSTDKDYSQTVKIDDKIPLINSNTLETNNLQMILIGTNSKDGKASLQNNQISMDVVTSVGNDNQVSKCHYLGNRKNIEMKLLSDQKMVLLTFTLPYLKNSDIGFGFDLNGNISESIIVLGNQNKIAQISHDTSKTFLPVVSTQINQNPGLFLFGIQFPWNMFYTISILTPISYLKNQSLIYYVEMKSNTSHYLEKYDFKILNDLNALNPNTLECTNFLQPTRAEIYEVGITITVLIIYVLLFILCVILYRFNPLNSRGLSPFLTLLFLFTQLMIEIRNYFQIPVYQASLCLAYGYGIYPLQQICFIMILFYFWKYFAHINLNESKKILSNFASESHVTQYYLWRTRLLKFISSSTFAITLSIFSYLISLLINTIILGSYNFTCKFQTLISLKVFHSCVNISVFVLMLLTLVSDIIANYKLIQKCRYIRSDLYYFRAQIIIFLPFMLFIFISEIVFLGFTKNYESIIRSHQSNVIVNTIIYSILLIIEVIYPICLTIYELVKRGIKHKNQATNDMIKSLKQDKVKELFIEFCKDKFCLEYFSLYDDIQKFKNEEQTAHNIYTKYLKGFSSPLQLNLPSSVVSKVIERMSNNDCEKDLFEECEKECLIILSDVYHRFQEWSEFKAHLSTHQNELEERENSTVGLIE